MNFLTHAKPFQPDPRTGSVRRRLNDLVEREHGYSFSLCRRRHPEGQILIPRAIGVVTARSGCILTHRMISALPSPLLLETNRQVEIVSLCLEPELMDEACVGILLRFAEGEEPRDVTASASCLPLDGLVFSTLHAVPPQGWPR